MVRWGGGPHHLKHLNLITHRPTATPFLRAGRAFWVLSLTRPTFIRIFLFSSPPPHGARYPPFLPPSDLDFSLSPFFLLLLLSLSSMASSSSPPPLQQPPISEHPEPPLAVPLLLPAPPPPPPSSRRLPPPCWTPDETAALIDAYRDKWYSLRRGNLRAPHWQEVADDVHRICPNVSPPKTAVQCRHKMEKLRKRYRAELQRAKSIPHHRFSSSWVYFPKMDSMEKGDSIFTGGGGNNNIASSVSPVLVSADDFIHDGFDDAVDDDDNDDDDDEDYNGGSFRKEVKDFQRNGLRIRIAGNSRKNYGGFDECPNPNPNPNPNLNLNPRFGYKSSSLKYNEFGTPPQFDGGVRYATRVVKNGNFNSGGGNGAGSSSSGMGLGMNVMTKKKRSALGKRGRQRGDGVAMEMVEAIRVLGEGFMSVEKMKMDMVRESERVRMENEMKRTQMILESQRCLVEAFAKGWSDLIVNNGGDGGGGGDDDDDDKNNN